MKTRFKSTLLLTISFLFLQTAFGNDGDQKLRDIVRAIDEASTAAYMKKDVDKMLSFYADDVISMPNFNTMMEGKAAIREHLEMVFQSGMEINYWESDIKKIWKKGNQIFVASTYKLKMSTPGGDTMTDEGKSFAVYEKRGKDYKIVIDIWNTDTNPWMQQ